MHISFCINFAFTEWNVKVLYKIRWASFHIRKPAALLVRPIDISIYEHSNAIHLMTQSSRVILERFYDAVQRIDSAFSKAYMNVPGPLQLQWPLERGEEAGQSGC